MTCTHSDTTGPVWAPGINSRLPWPEWLIDQHKLCDATLVEDTLACGGNESHLLATSRARRITASHVARVVRDWSSYAGEPVTLDDTLVGQQIGVPMTAFGSELAMLRLHYRLTVGRVGRSPAFGWYYVNK